ncbi:MAG: hypothetical protein AB7F88_16300 [Pyrinomonadaceae bacterium]
MDELSVADAYLEFLVTRRFASRENWNNVSVTRNIRHLEHLNAEVHAAYKRRELNGGVPIPLSWRRWANAQEALKK